MKKTPLQPPPEMQKPKSDFTLGQFTVWSPAEESIATVRGSVSYREWCKSEQVRCAKIGRQLFIHEKMQGEVTLICLHKRRPEDMAKGVAK